MGVDDDFWNDVLRHIRHRVLVPVVGPDLTTVKVGDTEQTLTTLIGQRLAEEYDMTMSPGTTMGEAVAALLERGEDEVELYSVINDIIVKHPTPGKALRNLAAIDDLRLFVTTTPDQLLARAVNEIRTEPTRQLTFSPSQSTSKQLSNAQPAAETDTVVLSLFGKAASIPQYAIHEEDRLEWLHALLSDEKSLPEWLAFPLKHQPLLFVGCDLPEWIGRFLLRMSSTMRLSQERKHFFFVGSSTAYEPSLSHFFETYCRKARVRQLQMAPTDFVAKLRERWEEQRPPQEDGDGHPPFPPPPPPDATIFISYMREDVVAARRLADAITEPPLGGDVWLDERRIRPGDTWKPVTLTAIHQTIRLFIPVISANTERDAGGYVFREWREAVERSLSIPPPRRFIVPVIIDKDYDPRRYKQIPDDFRPLHFGHAPAGDPDPALKAMLTEEIRAMRRTGAAC